MKFQIPSFILFLMDKWIPPAIVSLIIISVIWPYFLIIIGAIGIIYLFLLRSINRRLPAPFISFTENGDLKISWYLKQKKNDNNRNNHENSFKEDLGSFHETYLVLSNDPKGKNIIEEIYPQKKTQNEYTGNYSIFTVKIDNLKVKEKANHRKVFYQVYRISSSLKGKPNLASSKECIWGGDEFYFILPKQESFTPKSFKKDEKKTEISIVALGDLQPRAEIPPILQNRILKQAEEHHPDLFLYLGDHTNEGISPTAWRQFFLLIGNLAKNTPILGVPGNHDTQLSREGGKRDITNAYKTHVNYPGDKQRYYIKIQGINIIAFDFHTGFQKDSANYEIFEKCLKNMQEGDWVIVLWHSSPHNSLRTGKQQKIIRANIIPELEKQGNVVWLGGHEHSYQRFKVRDTYYITSAATSSFHDHHYNTEHMEKLIMKFHHLLIKVSKHKMKIKAIDIWGKIIDDFVIKARK